MNYYNEFDPFAAGWLKNLIAAGQIPAGIVDSRPIQEVTPNDVIGFTQCHFFAGIGGWGLALTIAGWPSNKPVWTGSCPCQPFSVAGKGLGAEDDRHLWPEFRRLIADGRPSAVFGEQVASADGRKWLSGVRADLETMGYGVGAADLCAAGVSAPHIRQRLYWVADADQLHDDRAGLDASHDSGERNGPQDVCRIADISRMGNTIDPGLQGYVGNVPDRDEPGRLDQDEDRSVATASGNSWSDYIVIPCGDGKARRIKPGLAPLVDGLSGRVGLIRGYGNAICPEVGAEFIRAYVGVSYE